MKMKLIKITSMALLAGFLIADTGCVRKIDEFGDTNINPGIVAEPITAALFTNVLAAMGGEIWSTTGGLYAQHYAETQYTEASRYARQQLDFSGYYSGVLFDLQNIINFNTNNPEKAAAYGSNANQIATARILKAWWTWRVVDAWGNVPYFEALKFNGSIPYDDQQAIYTDLFKELKEAVAQFDGGAAFQGDILLGGDITRWKQFANSIRVMMGVRIAKADAVKGKAEVLDALGSPGGVLTTNADDVMLEYPGGNFTNPWYSYYNLTQRRDFALSATLADFMVANGDRRVFAYGSANAAGTSVKGFPYGLTCPAQFPSVALPAELIVTRLVTGSTVILKPSIPATATAPPAQPNAPPATPAVAIGKLTLLGPLVINFTSGLPATEPLKASPDGTPGALYLVTTPDSTE